VFVLNRQKLIFVGKFKYIGHIINDKLNDNDDIQHEIKLVSVMQYADCMI